MNVCASMYPLFYNSLYQILFDEDSALRVKLNLNLKFLGNGRVSVAKPVYATGKIFFSVDFLGSHNTNSSYKLKKFSRLSTKIWNQRVYKRDAMKNPSIDHI
jgi:hypothetical protein